MKHGPQKPIQQVAVGLILRDGQILVNRRAADAHLPLVWEFPGGKVEEGESPRSALDREIEEETGLRVIDAALFHRQAHAYCDRTVDLHFFLCCGVEGDLTAAAADSTRWVEISALADLELPPANREVIELLQQGIAS